MRTLTSWAAVAYALTHSILAVQGKLKPWQPTLGPARLASKGKEVDMRLLDALQDREFVRVVLTTYSSNDVKVR